MEPNSGLVPVRFRFGSSHVTSFFASLNAALSEFGLKNEAKLVEPFWNRFSVLEPEPFGSAEVHWPRRDPGVKPDPTVPLAWP